MQKSDQAGLTLLELLVAVSVLSILVTIGAPDLIRAFKTQQIKGAGESVYFTLARARSTAISKGADVTVDFVAGANWCLGVSDTGDCDCAVANSCTVDAVETVLSSTNFSDVTLEALAFGANGQTVFDGARGMVVGNAGSLELVNGSDKLKVVVSNLGRTRLCISGGDQIIGYPSC